MASRRADGRTADGRDERKTSVAIIGTGLAGLTTAYLLQNDEQQRYKVTLFEQVRLRLSLSDLNSLPADQAIAGQLAGV